jgi:hypothetical protein
VKKERMALVTILAFEVIRKQSFDTTVGTLSTLTQGGSAGTSLFSVFILIGFDPSKYASTYVLSSLLQQALRLLRDILFNVTCIPFQRLEPVQYADWLSHNIFSM